MALKKKAMGGMLLKSKAAASNVAFFSKQRSSDFGSVEM
jgi:hypothetical protein